MKLSPVKIGAVVLVGALLLQVAFAVSYVGALHRPTPHQVPVAVIGTNAEQAAQQLNGLDGRPLKAQVVKDRATALRLVDHRDVYAIVEPAQNRLDVASAANKATATAIETTLDRVQAARKAPAFTVDDLKPLPAEDANGVSAFYAVVAWVFGGYLGATLLGMTTERRARSRAAALRRLGGMAAYAVIAGLVSLVVLREAFGVLDGPLLALWGTAALTILASGAAALGLQALLGLAGTGLVILLFVILGNAASGGPYARDLLPELWRTVGGILPPGAGVELARNITFFGGAHTLGALAVLAVWGLLGATAEFALGGRKAAAA